MMALPIVPSSSSSVFFRYCKNAALEREHSASGAVKGMRRDKNHTWILRKKISHDMQPSLSRRKIQIDLIARGSAATFHACGDISHCH